jgi:hypothetical protein
MPMIHHLSPQMKQPNPQRRFLVTTIAGTIFDTIAIIAHNPETAFSMLGNS